MKEEDGSRFLSALQDVISLEAELEASGEALHVHMY